MQPSVALSQGNNRRYFVGAPQEEALARLHFLVGSHKRLGLVGGDHGSGKTWTLARFAWEARGAGHEVGCLDAAGRDGREFLHQLADAVRARVAVHDARFQLWRSIRARLAENRMQRLATVLLCDHVEEATDEVRGLLARLLHEGDAPGSQLTVVMVAANTGFAPSSPWLQDRVELWVDIEPWSEQDVENYGEWRLRQEAVPGLQWEREALSQVWRLTGGLPRSVQRLVDLTLLAAKGDRAPFISGQTVDLVRDELMASL